MNQTQPTQTASLRNLQTQSLQTVFLSCQQRLRKMWILGTVMTLTLVGCELAMETPSPSPTQDVPNQSERPFGAAQSPTTAQMEAQVRQQINEVRQQKGLGALQGNQKLAQVARNYSQRMAREDFFSHVSPDGSTLAKRVRAGGLSYWVVGENLFMSTNAPQPVPLAVKGWMNSPGHRENILGTEYTETGVGVWREGNSYYITQLFMRSQPSLRDLFR